MPSMRPSELGFRMPAEWAPHSGCWMGWPQRVELWGDHMDAARGDYVKVAQAVARFEPVSMIADPEQVADAQARCGASVRVVPMPTDDSWLRDSGPTFLLDSMGRRAAAAFGFNAWGGKFHPYERDAAVGARVATLAGATTFRSDLVVPLGALRAMTGSLLPGSSH